MTTDEGPRVHPEPPAASEDRPPSRRALRERERERRRLAAASTGADDDLLPDEPHRYTVWHLLALAAVGGGLGLLIWSLDAPAGAAGAGGLDLHPTTTSSSAPPAAHRGEL